jgi:hypothetical protein
VERPDIERVEVPVRPSFHEDHRDRPDNELVVVPLRPFDQSVYEVRPEYVVVAFWENAKAAVSSRRVSMRIPDSTDKGI